MNRYLVLGSGMQGAAIGYYLAKHGQAEEVCLADISEKVAIAASEKINRLLGRSIAKSITADIRDRAGLISLMKKYRAVMSAIDYSYNLQITEAAIEAGVHLCDLGGNTDVVRSQLKWHEKALLKNISIIPDCGLAPGLGNTLAACGIESMDECDEVQVRCGGLPQTPRPPLDYKLVFNIRGLTNEYFGKAWILREGHVQEISTFTELETLEFRAPVGRCEAFVTTGGSSTAPWTFQNKVKTYEYKTVRYPGHFEKIKCMMDLGLLDLSPVTVKDIKGEPHQIAPREIFHAVVPSHIDFPEDRDLVVLRATCRGKKNGQPRSVRYELIDFHDEKTGFSAMERGTGYPAAEVLIHAVEGLAKKGVVPLEAALQNKIYLERLTKRELKISEDILES